MTLAGEIKKRKTVSFSEFQELALYDENFGFYENGGGAGRDFITSAEIGAVFAEVIASVVDRWWKAYDEPDPFYFVEVGAGRGTFANNFLQAVTAPVQYIAVERSNTLRKLHAGSFESRATIPTELTGATGILFCNELLDNMPVDIYDDKDELRVKVKAGQPVWARDIVGEAFPEQTVAAKWLRDAVATFDQGRLIAVDYMRTTAEMRALPMEQWLRAYRGQVRGTAVFDSAGDFDITCDVALDQLRWVLVPASEMTQSDYLQKHGIGLIKERAQAEWQERAAVGDLDALKAKSRLSEVAALTDPAGLGGFTVVEWDL